MILLLLCVLWLVEMYNRWKFVAYASYKDMLQNICPKMQEDYIEQANAVDGAFNGQPQRKYDPFSDTYNLEGRDHSNVRYGNSP